jgi:hypothetical protein
VVADGDAALTKVSPPSRSSVVLAAGVVAGRTLGGVLVQGNGFVWQAGRPS